MGLDWLIVSLANCSSSVAAYWMPQGHDNRPFAGPKDHRSLHPSTGYQCRLSQVFGIGLWPFVRLYLLTYLSIYLLWQSRWSRAKLGQKTTSWIGTEPNGDLFPSQESSHGIHGYLFFRPGSSRFFSFSLLVCLPIILTPSIIIFIDGR